MLSPPRDGLQITERKTCRTLRNLPGLALLHEGLSSIDYNEEQDEFIRAEQGSMATRPAVLKPDGTLCLMWAARHINDFSAKTELAVACVREPNPLSTSRRTGATASSKAIDIRGQEIIPCQFKTIERAVSAVRPCKVFPGRKASGHHRC